MPAAANTIRKPSKYRNERGGKFRVLVGAHIDNGPPGCECDECSVSDGKNHLYRQRDAKDPPAWAGDIIETTADLEMRFNAGPYSRKFERVREDAPAVVGHVWDQAKETLEQFTARMNKVNAPKPSLNLDAMALKDLQQLAADEEIDLKGAKTKEEAVKVIKASL